jgi:class 3 adenylate cyclase
MSKRNAIGRTQSMTEATPLFQTIMFADIAGSTCLYDQLGDTLAKNMVDTCIRLMGRIVRSNQGGIVKTIGDEIMCRFDQPDAAVQAATTIQEATSTVPELMSRSIQLRIGLHHGAVIEEGKDLFGDAVNVAARMAGQAKAGQIITSRQTIELMIPEIQAKARLVDQAQVKGKQDIIDIFEIVWGKPEEMTIMGTLTGQIVTTPASRDSLMIVNFGDQHISISHDHPMITMGRDATNRIVINSPKVSRLHARIEIRKDKFVLVDQSTNGTYVHPKDGDMALLRRDEIPLAGEGTISLGQKAPSGSQLVIHYQSL